MATKIDELTESHREVLHDEAFFRAAARRALTALPELQAVLLFGSRARGTARSDSDWDLALIAKPDCERNPHELILAASATDLGQRGVEMLVLGEKELQAKRNSAGTMVRTVLLTSRPLAGHMPDVGEIEAVARMDSEIFEIGIRSICDQLAIAAMMFAKSLNRPNPKDIVQGHGRSFVAATADAAEHLAKLMIDRRDVRFANTHNLNALADDLDRGSDGQWSETARKIRDMNGGTRVHHQLTYPEISAPGPQDMVHAVRRVEFVASYLVEECQNVASDSNDPELAASGRWALEYLSMTASEAMDLLQNKEPAREAVLEATYEYEASAEALLAGYDTVCGLFNRLVAVAPG